VRSLFGVVEQNGRAYGWFVAVAISRNLIRIWVEKYEASIAATTRSGRKRCIIPAM
jgi:hypothetical protein